MKKQHYITAISNQITELLAIGVAITKESWNSYAGRGRLKWESAIEKVPEFYSILDSYGVTTY
jgi:hypothetical protein